MAEVVLVTGAGSGFGALAARALAKSSHTVYASMRAVEGRNADRAKETLDYAAELARFNIETSIVVPGAYTSGTNHFASAGHPADTRTVEVYETKYAGLMEQIGQRLAELAPADADVAEVATEIARIVDLPFGQRPFRVRTEFYGRIGLADLLSPHTAA